MSLSPVSASKPHSHVHEECCKINKADGTVITHVPGKDPPKKERYIVVMETIIVLACVLFAAYKAPLLLAVGFVAGVAYEMIQIRKGVVLPSIGGGGASCGQTIVELIMNRPSLNYEVTAVVGYFFFFHLRHEATVYIPVVGAFLGIRAVDYAHQWLKENKSKVENKEVNSPLVLIEV